MGLALNLIALLMVIGLSWTAMMWMSGRFHGDRRDFSAQPLEERVGPNDEFELVADRRPAHQGECTTCQGSGARKRQGRLSLCPVCEGTGVLN